MSAPVAGQVAVTAAAQVLSSTVGAVAAFTVKAPLTNVNPVFMGPASVTLASGYQLDPGDVFEYERRNQIGGPSYEMTPGDIFVVGTAGDKVTWLASP
jgi:hypothetical protein